MNGDVCAQVRNRFPALHAHTCSSGLAATCWKNEDCTSGSSIQCGTARTISGSIPAQLCRYLAKSFTCGKWGGDRVRIDRYHGMCTKVRFRGSKCGLWHTCWEWSVFGAIVKIPRGSVRVLS